MLAICKSRYPYIMSADGVHINSHEQNYLMSELESLGLTAIYLNEFNDNSELLGLVRHIKDSFLEEFHHTWKAD